MKIFSRCGQVVGTVVSAPKLNPGDGDVTFNVRPEPAYESMMNAQNRSDGGLHVEIVPMDQPGCTPGRPIERMGYDNLGVCSGANVVFPPLGAHVRITGPFVFDRWAGPNEIHPAWMIEILPLKGPTGPEQKVLKARLTGQAIVGTNGAPRGTGTVVVMITGKKLCWRFSGVRRFGTPTRAQISRGRVGHNGPRVLTLGARYHALGCRTVSAGTLEAMANKATSYYVTLSSKAHPSGALRGQLRRVRD